jgi:hypothetical protein
MLKENRWWLLIFSVVAILLASQIIITASHAQQQYITAKDANKYIGEVQTVCAMVASTKFSSQGKKQPTFINLDQPYPKQIFTVSDRPSRDEV